MKQTLSLLVLTVAFFTNSFGQSTDHINVVTSDITRFWEAYDLVLSSTDSLEQVDIIQKTFLDPATPGQKAMIEARRYDISEYRNAMLSYPKFWTSIRSNTLKADEYAAQLLEGISKAKKIYPEARPATIYFTMGVFRSPGTTTDDMVLIGSEFAMADDEANIEEFPEQMQFLEGYYANDPLSKLVELNTHEYFHTQQSTSFGTTLLTQSIREGVAEFMAEIATGIPSASECIIYGKANEEKVMKAFEQDMFNYNYTYWLWSQRENEFNQRDLSYFAGYVLVQKYYNEANNKKKAIKRLVELDYTSDEAIESFVNDIRYFKMPLMALKRKFNNNRPVIYKIDQFKNRAKDVDASITTITVHFSVPMDEYSRGFDFGPLGEDAVLSVQKVIGYSEDRKSFSWNVSMEKGKHYQVELTSRFSSESGAPMLPYLIDITTSN